MADLNIDEGARREVLIHSQAIAIVGRSNDHYYTSYQVGEYFKEHGFTEYNVNPNLDEIDGDPSYASLKDVPGPIDIVDVFRHSDHLSGIVDEAIAVGAKTAWGRLGAEDDGARQNEKHSGVNVSTNLCL